MLTRQQSPFLRCHLSSVTGTVCTSQPSAATCFYLQYHGQDELWEHTLNINISKTQFSAIQSVLFLASETMSRPISGETVFPLERRALRASLYSWPALDGACEVWCVQCCTSHYLEVSLCQQVALLLVKKWFECDCTKCRPITFIVFSKRPPPFQTFPMGCFVGTVVHSVSLVYIVVNIAFIYISYLLSVHV